MRRGASPPSSLKRSAPTINPKKKPKANSRLRPGRPRLPGTPSREASQFLSPSIRSEDTNGQKSGPNSTASNTMRKLVEPLGRSETRSEEHTSELQSRLHL